MRETLWKKLDNYSRAVDLKYLLVYCKERIMFQIAIWLWDMQYILIKAFLSTLESILKDFSKEAL